MAVGGPLGRRRPGCSRSRTAPRRGAVPSPRGTRRLWTTLPDAEARAIRADAFARSSKGLPAYYDYRSWSATTFDAPRPRDGQLRVAVVFVRRRRRGLARAVRVVRAPAACERYDLSEFERMYALIFTALGFMLVFRLSRAAVRFWDCRAAWGLVIMRGARRRHPPLVSFGSSEIHTHRSRVRRVAKVLFEVRAFALSTLLVPDERSPDSPLREIPFSSRVGGRRDRDVARVEASRDGRRDSVGVRVLRRVEIRLLRRERIPSLQLAGVLDEAEVAEIERVSTHTHLYCANKMRRAIAGALLERGDERDSASIDASGCTRLRRGAAPRRARTWTSWWTRSAPWERIKATRLPIAYVAHLRTFLLLSCWGFRSCTRRRGGGRGARDGAGGLCAARHRGRGDGVRESIQRARSGRTISAWTRSARTSSGRWNRCSSGGGRSARGVGARRDDESEGRGVGV